MLLYIVDVDDEEVKGTTGGNYEGLNRKQRKSKYIHLIYTFCT